jgi:hypothetical protein
MARLVGLLASLVASLATGLAANKPSHEPACYVVLICLHIKIIAVCKKKNLSVGGIPLFIGGDHDKKKKKKI